MWRGDDLAQTKKHRRETKSAPARFLAITRAGIPDGITNAAVYLVSDEVSFINDEDIVIDGGLIRGRRSSEAMASLQVLRGLFE